MGAFRETGLVRDRDPVCALFFKLFRAEPADYSEVDPGAREEDASSQ
jgi:hypothetical protein